LNHYGFVSIKRGSELFGYSEQAYHKGERHEEEQCLKAEKIETLIRTEIQVIRQRMPRIGGEKLHILISPKLDKLGLSVGRDKFMVLYETYGFKLKKRKSYKKTTDSHAWRWQFEDLRKDLVVTRPEQLIVCDITYIETEEEDGYIPLLTDAYSKLIMGYEVSTRMRACDCLVALQMAIKNRQYNGLCIHHTDRGSQYLSKEYTDVLKAAKPEFVSSATQDGSPYDNAVAERINRIIKEEFGFDGKIKKIKNIREAKILMKKVVEIYNKERPHFSNQMLTPWQMHQQNEIPIKTWAMKKKTSE
jgi:putative transposase